MRSPGGMNDSPYFERWSHDTIGVAQDNFAWDDLFGLQNDIFRSQHRLLTDAQIAPYVGVAILIAALRMYNGHIWLYGGNKQERSAIQGRAFLTKSGIMRCQIATQC